MGLGWRVRGSHLHIGSRREDKCIDCSLPYRKQQVHNKPRPHPSQRRLYIRPTLELVATEDGERKKKLDYLNFVERVRS